MIKQKLGVNDQATNRRLRVLESESNCPVSFVMNVIEIDYLNEEYVCKRLGDSGSFEESEDLAVDSVDDSEVTGKK